MLEFLPLFIILLALVLGSLWVVLLAANDPRRWR